MMQDAVERRLRPHDEGLAKDLGVKGPFNSDDTYRLAITIGDKQRAIDLARVVQQDLGPQYNVRIVVVVVVRCCVSAVLVCLVHMMHAVCSTVVVPLLRRLCHFSCGVRAEPRA